MIRLRKLLTEHGAPYRLRTIYRIGRIVYAAWEHREPHGRKFLVAQCFTTFELRQARDPAALVARRAQYAAKSLDRQRANAARRKAEREAQYTILEIHPTP